MTHGQTQIKGNLFSIDRWDFFLLTSWFLLFLSRFVFFIWRCVLSNLKCSFRYLLTFGASRRIWRQTCRHHYFNNFHFPCILIRSIIYKNPTKYASRSKINFNHNFITTRFGRYWHHFQDDNIKRIQNWCILFVISIFLSITLQACIFILIIILLQHVSAADTIFKMIILKEYKIGAFYLLFPYFCQ